MRKKVILVLLAVLCAALAAGCGKKEDDGQREEGVGDVLPENGNTDEAPREKIEITVADDPDDEGITFQIDGGSDLYTMPVITLYNEDSVVEAGSDRTLSVDNVTVWQLEEEEEGSETLVCADPVIYTDEKALAADGMYIVWGTFGDSDAEFSNDVGFSTTVTYPCEGSYWVLARLIDRDGNTLQTAYCDRVTVE